MHKRSKSIALFIIGGCFLFILGNITFSVLAEDDEQILERARQLRDEGSWSQSIVEYDRYIGRNPQNITIRKEIGMVYGWNEEWKNSQEELEKYIQDHPDDIEALEILGNVYLYSDQYKKAKQTYEKIVSIDPSLEEKLQDRIRQANLAMGPYAVYSFYYYREKNRKTNARSTTLLHEWEWYQPINGTVHLIPSYGIRIDDEIHKYTPIYGIGYMAKVLERSWLRQDVRFEKDRRINPRVYLRSVFTTIPKERYEVNIAQETTWYWDGNASYTGSLDISRLFLKDESFITRLSLIYNNSKTLSPYFVRIEPPDTPGKHLDLFTGALTLEKRFKINEALGIALGNSYSIDTDETKRFFGFGRLDYKVNDRINLYLGGSYGRDTDEYEYITGSVYMSVKF